MLQQLRRAIPLCHHIMYHQGWLGVTFCTCDFEIGTDSQTVEDALGEILKLTDDVCGEFQILT